MNNMSGRVIKKNNKKITVIVKKCLKIPIYKKRIFYYKKILAYDIFDECNFGDYVMIKKSRPLTKTIFWILSKVIEKIKII
ncbi:30S ribosomal protein S17 [Candidatus Carsonella ruddii (Diaphorina cf. continua)]|uniref:30S ribosomal protein S17 n=2 Tax=Carsonella ruddii TaxID=114186 RepID=A0A7R6VYG0_CARRU|nr:30S ribosomal protein S17 [Candidatus Carsonella ruddii (Diaphorina cf. continua)]